MITYDGNIFEEELPQEEWQVFWNRILEHQPMDDELEQSIYRETVDDLLDKFPIRALSPERIADYTRYSALKGRYETKLAAEGFSEHDMKHDLGSILCSIWRYCETIADCLLGLVKEEIWLFLEDEEVTHL